MSASSAVTLPMPPGPISGPAAWFGPDMAERSDWVHVLAAEDIDEIDAAIRRHVASRLGMDRITPATFRLPRLAAKLERILGEILHGRGFAVIRGFPVDRYTVEEAAIGYLGLGAYFGSFRSQNAKGHLLGHVKDIGLDIRDGGTRFYQTNRQLDYHTDSCDIVGLLCLKTAKMGGASRVVSSVTLYNEMLRRRPDLAAALFDPVPTDRRSEVPPGMLPWFEIPVFNWYGNELTTIYVGQYIRSAQANFPQAPRISAAKDEALRLLDDLANSPDLRLEMSFEPGDMQFLHNHQILHSRTDFADWDEPERRRHLLRLWLAPAAARPLPPAFAARYGAITPGDRGGIVTNETKLKFVLDAE